MENALRRNGAGTWFPAFPPVRRMKPWDWGVAALRGNELLAGASSYARSRDAIEIEIDTREDMKNRGLASACGAALILEFLERGLYPSWDAHTEISAALAEKLGYHVSHPYVVYEVEADKGPV